jgi:Mn2+/Fe2+ NRAMP family transporter
MRKTLERYRAHILVFLAVLGPGFITAMVDNDSGGIIMYSSAGAQFGYLPLWTLLPITVMLIITQEMCSRMGAVTGKGLADLIREEFGLRMTFLLMTLLVLVNLTNVMTEFAGVAGSMELFHISKYISVPLAAIGVWFLVVKGNYVSVEKVFLFASLIYVTYIISGFLVRPDWKAAAINSVRPILLVNSDYIYMLIGMVGTTIAPWMQFYLQSAVVEKGVTAKDYAASRLEVTVGCIMTNVIAFFIIVACAGAIWSIAPQKIDTPAQAAVGLRPFGQYAVLLFSGGLLNASIFAASILPLSTAYSVCEGLGFESGVNRRISEAPIFYFLYTFLIVIGAGVVLIPNFPLVRMIVFSQVLNGVLLPFILIFMVLLVNKKDLMGEWVNPRWFNWASWATVVIMVGLTAVYTIMNVKHG